MVWLKQTLLSDKMPKENEHYSCIAPKTIDSVTRMGNKNYPQIDLEEYKYRIKKTKMTKFKSNELESNSESELESDTELEAKSEPHSDSE